VGYCRKTLLNSWKVSRLGKFFPCARRVFLVVLQRNVLHEQTPTWRLRDVCESGKVLIVRGTGSPEDKLQGETVLHLSRLQGATFHARATWD